MYHSEKIDEIAQALAKFQGTIGSVNKNKTAKIPTKSGSAYSYAYADLTGIWDAIRNPLKENNLSLSQTFSYEENRAFICTLLMHGSGQWLQSKLPLKNENLKTQELGSEITYLRRYALSSILGISADEDEDGAIANNASSSQSNKIESMDEPRTISIDQYKTLVELLKDCNEGYRKYLFDYVKKNYECEMLDLPLSLFEKVKSWIIEQQQKQKRIGA